MHKINDVHVLSEYLMWCNMIVQVGPKLCGMQLALSPNIFMMH